MNPFIIALYAEALVALGIFASIVFIITRF
jgi:hypothetical protein